MTARQLLPVVRVVGLALLTLFGPYRWQHRNRVPKQCGVLLLANHTSDIDPILVQGALRRKVIFMAKEELFSMRWLGKILEWFEAFPVKRGAPDRVAIRRAVDLLKKGEVVCVFPEGKLSETGELQEILPGVALIARMAGCPVVCARIRRANRIMPYGKTIPRPALGWVTITFGEPWHSTDDFIGQVRSEILSL